MASLLEALETVGALSDTPGSIIRDALTFTNPIDQLKTATSFKNRKTGSDVLRSWNLLGRGGGPAHVLAGIATEIATDPLSWVNPFESVGHVPKLIRALRLW